VPGMIATESRIHPRRVTQKREQQLNSIIRKQKIIARKYRLY
jgi:hypothetical protein